MFFKTSFLFDAALSSWDSRRERCDHVAELGSGVDERLLETRKIDSIGAPKDVCFCRSLWRLLASLRLAATGEGIPETPPAEATCSVRTLCSDCVRGCC